MPRILVVDDEIALCELLMELLGRWGYIGEYATDAGEAIHILGTKPCDLAIIDLMMPGMKGDELAPHIKKRNPNIPVVMISAFPPLELPAVDEIHSKPISPQKLRQIIQKWLDPQQSKCEAA